MRRKPAPRPDRAPTKTAPARRRRRASMRRAPRHDHGAPRHCQRTGVRGRVPAKGHEVAVGHRSGARPQAACGVGPPRGRRPLGAARRGLANARSAAKTSDCHASGVPDCACTTLLIATSQAAAAARVAMCRSAIECPRSCQLLHRASRDPRRMKKQPPSARRGSGFARPPAWPPKGSSGRPSTGLRTGLGAALRWPEAERAR